MIEFGATKQSSVTTMLSMFVKRNAVHEIQDCGIVKRLVFKDGASLDVRYAGSCRDLYGEGMAQGCPPCVWA
jgi:hypothetical protein